MSIVGWSRNRVDRYRRSRKGISTIMANLMMLVIVVVLASILFIWSVSSFSTYQGGAGYWFSSRSLANQERVSVENVFFFAGIATPSCPNPCNTQVRIYYRNVGATPVTVATAYFSSPSYSVSKCVSAPPCASAQLNINSVANVTLPLNLLGGYQWQSGTLYTVKLATLRGTTVTTTWVA